MKELNQVYRKFRRNEITLEEWHSYIATQDKSEVLKVVNTNIEAQSRLTNYKNSFRYQTMIRKYCNLYLHSDIHPYEVVRIISDKCVEVRPMLHKQTVFPKEFHSGGFSGHYADNYAQKYEYSSNPEASTKRVRLGKRGWDGGRFRMEDEPVYFYDYNF